MEERGAADTSRIAVQGDTSLGLCLLQLVKGLEATVGHSLVSEGPEAFTQKRSGSGQVLSAWFFLLLWSPV